MFTCRAQFSQILQRIHAPMPVKINKNFMEIRNEIGDRDEDREDFLIFVMSILWTSLCNS